MKQAALEAARPSRQSRWPCQLSAALEQFCLQGQVVRLLAARIVEHIAAHASSMRITASLNATTTATAGPSSRPARS